MQSTNATPEEIPVIWFPKEEDLWVPSDSSTLSSYLLSRVTKTGSHTAFAGYDTVVSVNPNHASASAKDGARETFGQLWQKVRSDPSSVQSILIVGDSGSGKTVAFDAFLSQAPVARASGINEWFHHAQALLTAFGCASLPRNPNSSRYVNILRLGFTSADARIVSAQVLPTLLEKSRITERNPSESNFHILRQLWATAPEAMRSELFLLADEDEKQVDGGTAMSDPQAIWDSLSFFGVSPESAEARELMAILASIRALHRLSFAAAEGADNTEPAVVKRGSLEEVASLLGVTVPALQLCLCQRRIMAGGQRRSVHEGNLTVPLAEMCRDVLSKEVYEMAFWWIVDRINARAPHAASPDKTLFLVDAFGFENHSAAENKVEQLCVNYINDLVYGRYFRREVLVREEEAYVSEGLPWDFPRSRIPDSELSLDLVGRRNTGLLALLDEQTRLGAIASDGGYLCETRGMWGKSGHPCYAKPRFDEDSGFVVKHFVAPVTYTVLDFVDRNSEGVHKTFANFRAMLEGSTLSVVTRALDLPELHRLGDRNMGERVVQQTAALQTLLDASEHNHFVLCLRSSSQPSRLTPPGAYEEALMERQVQNFKIYDACQARNKPVHVDFETFGRAFEDVFRAVGVSKQYTPEICARVLSNAITVSKWAVGKTKIFLSADAKRVLLYKGETVERLTATRIQSTFRMFKAAKEFKKDKSALHIQAAWRGHTVRRQAKRQHEAVVRIQAVIRMYKARVATSQTKQDYTDATTKISAMVRMWQARVHFARTKVEYQEASTKISAHFRAMIAKREKHRRLKAVILIQATWRGYVARRTFEQICLGRMMVNSLVATPFLRPGEAVVLCGVVLKKSRMIALSSWTRRVLVLTTAPRLLYIDPKKAELRGEIPYTADDHVVLLTDKEFDLITPKRTFKFRTLMKPSAAFWSHVLQNPSATPNFMLGGGSRESVRRVNMKDLKRVSVRQSVRPGDLAPAKQVKSRTMLRNMNWKEARDVKVGKIMQLQGYMLKYEHTLFGSWTRRYFLIQDNTLCWFARSGDVEPLGKIVLNSSLIMRDTEETRKNSFTIEGSSAAPGAADGNKVMIRLTAFSPEHKKEWIDGIKTLAKVELYPYTY